MGVGMQINVVDFQDSWQNEFMKKALIWLTSNWHLAAFIVVVDTSAFLLLAIWSKNYYAQLLAYAVVLITLGLLFRRRWARYAGTAVLVCMVLHKTYGLFTMDFSWRRAGQLMLCVYSAYLLWTAPDESFFKEWGLDDSDSQGKGGEDDEDSPPKPLISLVHLRAAQRYLEPIILAQALSDAWGRKIHGGEGDPPDDADGFVVGQNPVFMVMVQEPSFAMFVVHNLDQPYFDDVEDTAKSVPNLRFAQIIREHRSWLAIDLMEISEVDPEEGYRMIGKAISALADDQTTAIVCPQHNFFNLWSEELETLLCGDSPLDALREEVKAPVFGVPNGELIEKAIAEARQRWPEFVAIFQRREPDDDRFIVKAAFEGEDGQTEHMWLSVIGLEPEHIHGHLMNEPMHTSKLKKGSQVEVPLAHLSDWICPDAEDNPLGNFTHQAIQQAARQKRES